MSTNPPDLNAGRQTLRHWSSKTLDSSRRCERSLKERGGNSEGFVSFHEGHESSCWPGLHLSPCLAP